ncbi:MAG: NFACT RNA binding domain-containing protein [Candidatus Acetothermia bacterium]|nr:NFACT RNA binding domain-containing protein [Candidatus Acetothermia bacterium]
MEPTPNKAEAPTQPREFLIGGFTVIVGRSAGENDRLVRTAQPDDIWLHARGVPGAHVLVRSGGRPVPEAVLRRAAELAAWHSRARGERKVEVSYTEARYLRKPKGAPAGAVAVRKENVVVVPGEKGP